MKIGSKGLALIKKWEEFRNKPYLCPAGVPTIGYGSTYYENGVKVKLSDRAISEVEASHLMEYITNRDFASKISRLLKVEVTQSMFDALVSFAYNVGMGNFQSSTLLKKVNVMDFGGAAEEFAKWVKAGGGVLKGLVSRRADEKALFVSELK